MAGGLSWTAAQEKPAASEAQVAAEKHADASAPTNAARAASGASAKLDASDRIKGEKRFRANCGRCHAAPHKFPPRMMATIVRHMRVRATITDEDMRLILLYMTQ